MCDQDVMGIKKKRGSITCANHKVKMPLVIYFINTNGESNDWVYFKFHNVTYQTINKQQINEQ